MLSIARYLVPTEPLSVFEDHYYIDEHLLVLNRTNHGRPSPIQYTHSQGIQPSEFYTTEHALVVIAWGNSCLYF